MTRLAPCSRLLAASVGSRSGVFCGLCGAVAAAACVGACMFSFVSVGDVSDVSRLSDLLDLCKTVNHLDSDSCSCFLSVQFALVCSFVLLSFPYRRGFDQPQGGGGFRQGGGRDDYGGGGDGRDGRRWALRMDVLGV